MQDTAEGNIHMENFSFGGVTFYVLPEHLAGYLRLASWAQYEEAEDGHTTFAGTYAREDECPWEVG